MPENAQKATHGLFMVRNATLNRAKLNQELLDSRKYC